MTGAEFFLSITTASIILFVIGIILMIVELCIPGFGAFGIGGIVCLILAVALSAKSLTHGLVLASIVLLTLGILFVVFLILASKGIVPQKLILKDSTDKVSGYSSMDTRLESLVGRQGVAVTTLRPAGCMEIDGEKIDVVTNGEFIEAGSALLVMQVNGNRVVVKQA